LEDTNDIGFTAVRVGEGKAVPAGIYFRVAFGGITGHKDFAIDEGLLLRPDQCVSFAGAVVRLFVKHGNRTDRKKARLKYLLDDWGHEKFVAESLKEWGQEALRWPLAECEPRPSIDKAGHIGWHSQKQEGLSYIGVVLPVGRMTTEQMRGIARISDNYGSGDIRLTVWQNLLIADIPEAQGKLEIDQNINIHVTGCPNSCAQHYIGDIGFLGTKVEEGDDMVDGFHLFVGGGYGEEQNIGREIVRSINAENMPDVTERLLKAYLSTRLDVLESFHAWSQRFSTEELQAFCA
jgi:ferredoxin-nitrite reductase